MKNLIFFGKPGAGKGTQAELIKNNYELTHISTGDVFRANIKNTTTLGEQAQDYMRQGKLVPDEITINMLAQEIEKNNDTSGFIFDGFPRTQEQAKALDSLLERKGMKINAVIMLDANEEELTQRILERGKESLREDDTNEEKVKVRFQEYNDKTRPLIDFYKQQQKLSIVNGIGKVDEVTQRILEAIEMATS